VTLVTFKESVCQRRIISVLDSLKNLQGNVTSMSDYYIAIVLIAELEKSIFAVCNLVKKAFNCTANIWCNNKTWHFMRSKVLAVAFTKSSGLIEM
jgi:hypothetical protein